MPPEPSRRIGAYRPNGLPVLRAGGGSVAASSMLGRAGAGLAAVAPADADASGAAPRLRPSTNARIAPRHSDAPAPTRSGTDAGTAAIPAGTTSRASPGTSVSGKASVAAPGVRPLPRSMPPPVSSRRAPPPSLSSLLASRARSTVRDTASAPRRSPTAGSGMISWTSPIISAPFDDIR